MAADEPQAGGPSGLINDDVSVASLAPGAGSDEDDSDEDDTPLAARVPDTHNDREDEDALGETDDEEYEDEESEESDTEDEEDEDDKPPDEESPEADDESPEADDETPTSRQHGGGGKRDPVDPSKILGYRRPIVATPRATPTTHRSAARRDPKVDPESIPAIESPSGDGSPMPGSSPPFSPLRHIQPHYSETPGGSPVLTLRLENTAVDDPEHDTYSVPLADLRLKRRDQLASLPAITRYLLAVAEHGKDVSSSDYDIKPKPKTSNSKRGLGTHEEGEASSHHEPATDNKAGADEGDVFLVPPHSQTTAASPGRAGRPSLDTQANVDAGIQLLGTIRRALADVTDVSESYIQTRWDKQVGLKPKGGDRSLWRTFLKYYHADALGLISKTNCTLAADEPTNNNTVAGRCYDAFKNLYPEKWKEILETFEDLAALEGNQKTVHNRNTDWNLHRRRLLDVIEKGQEQGFETYAVSCGSNVHQDKGLGVSEESTGAAGVSG